MARDDPHFRLRIPQDLKDQIEEAANTHQRPINAEIVSRLYQTTMTAEQLAKAQDDHILLIRNSMKLGYDLVYDRLGMLPELDSAINDLVDAQSEPKPEKMDVIRMLVKDKLIELGFYEERQLSRK